MNTSMMTRADPAGSTMDEARTRRAVLALFAVDGFGFGLWAAHIPAFKASLGLSDGALSVPLFAMVVGSLVAMPLAGRRIASDGSRRVAIASACLFCAILPAVALSVWLGRGMVPFAVAALLFGAFKGALDVAANAQAVAVERDGPRPIVSTCHGCWSLGSLLGAGSAAIALRAGLPPTGTLLAGGGMLLIASLSGAGALRRDGGIGPGAASKTSPWPSGRLAMLGVLAFLALFCEGAVSDWSAVYLAGPVGVSPASAALGFAAYMTAMTSARFAGDRLVAAFGPSGLLRAGGLLVAAGLGGALAFRTFPAALVGFGLVGMGLANAVPVLFRSAGRERDAAGAIATVSTVGYLGFLAGPPMIGLMSELSGLRAALVVVVGFGVLIAIGSRLVRGEPEATSLPGPRGRGKAGSRAPALAS